MYGLEDASLASLATATIGESSKLDRMEKITAVCNFFCQGLTVREIQEAMKDEYGEAGAIKREEPYAILAFAASRGWLQFRAPHHLEYGHRLRSHYTWLQRVDIVRTVMTWDVARQAALVLLDLVRDKVRQRGSSQEVHIGFAGGVSMQKLARAFADLLCDPWEQLPETIVFHTMVAGFNPTDPITDPNAFFTYFLNEPIMQVKPRFVGLHAPAVVEAGDVARLRALPEIEQAFTGAQDLDIIATSGADWSDEHSLLNEGIKRCKKSFATLERAGCVGDILWRPIGKRGPIEDETAVRAMTVMELSDLPRFIRSGNHVLLMLGPCAGCNRSKGHLLGTVLDQRQPLITHLVADSRSAAGVVRRLPR
jgi:hypothetical protein